MRKVSGFTLIELMITVVVVAILAAIAVPSYIQYIQRGKISEAIGNLSSARLQLEKYYADNHMYGTGNVCGVTMPSGADAQYFQITCTSGNANAVGDQTYLITAAGIGSMSGFQYTINESNVRQSTFSSPVTGWNNSTTCWVTKKGESC
jgi:prepilin-type N-terminal cleavage/methylation domain-containing protein